MQGARCGIPDHRTDRRGKRPRTPAGVILAELEVQGLAKRYGPVEALRGIDLKVAAGEFFVILGPSAAGKTTTLRAIAGLERPDAGRIRFGGRDLSAAPVQGRGMAMIFQTFALYPHLSVRANLAYPLRQKGVAGAEIGRQVERIATMLRIGHTLDRRPATLSGGEQQRLAIGRALIQQPALLLLDEPLTNLDAKLRHDTRAEFKRLHRELGMTMVYATPDQLEALSMGERIAVLREGRIVQTGTPDALYDQPADSFVATMLGAPPMNLVPGRVTDGAAGPAIALPFLQLQAERWRSALARDAEVLVGIRPHDLAPARGAARGPQFGAKVHLIEPLGDVTVLDLEAGGTVLKMVLPEEEALAYPVGAELAVELAAEAHLFDRESGLALG
jgi:multiple sugar transport system ATP-binding protein